LCWLSLSASFLSQSGELMPDEPEKTTPTEDDIAKLIADSNPDFP